MAHRIMGKVEAYWVASHGETPQRIYFDASAAFNSEYLYIDSFDAQGEPVVSYKRRDDAVFEGGREAFTTEF